MYSPHPLVVSFAHHSLYSTDIDNVYTASLSNASHTAHNIDESTHGTSKEDRPTWGGDTPALVRGYRLRRSLKMLDPMARYLQPKSRAELSNLGRYYYRKMTPWLYSGVFRLQCALRTCRQELHYKSKLCFVCWLAV